MQSETNILEIMNTPSLKSYTIRKNMNVKELLSELNLDKAFFVVVINKQRASLDTKIFVEDSITILPKIAGGNESALINFDIMDESHKKVIRNHLEKKKMEKDCEPCDELTKNITSIEKLKQQYINTTNNLERKGYMKDQRLKINRNNEVLRMDKKIKIYKEIQKEDCRDSL